MEPPLEMNNQQWLALQNRALAVAAEGITIVDARLPGRPLIYVNEGFERLTGYRAAEVLGRNCKFLQGQGTDPNAARHISNALAEERDCTVEILNYRKDGTFFWNRLSITPVRDQGGRVTHFIGIQSDVSQRRLAEDALRAANANLEQANAILQRDLAEAAQIQRSWLPRSLPRVKGFRFAWSFTPCQELGGDSLNVLHLDQDHIGVYVLDVSGHGVGAALLSASIQRWLSPIPEHSCLFARERKADGTHDIVFPGAVAAELNRRFLTEPESGKFFTLVYGVLDLGTGEFRYATAGHPPPLLVGRKGAAICPLAPGVPAGVLEDFSYGESRIQLDPGDRLLLYTDGAPDTTAKDGRPYGMERLLANLEKNADQLPDEALADLLKDLKEWGEEDDLEDDVTLLAFDMTEELTRD